MPLSPQPVHGFTGERITHPATLMTLQQVNRVELTTILSVFLPLGTSRSKAYDAVASIFSDKHATPPFTDQRRFGSLAPGRSALLDRQVRKHRVRQQPPIRRPPRVDMDTGDSNRIIRQASTNHHHSPPNNEGPQLRLDRGGTHRVDFQTARHRPLELNRTRPGEVCLTRAQASVPLYRTQFLRLPSTNIVLTVSGIAAASV